MGPWYTLQLANHLLVMKCLICTSVSAFILPFGCPMIMSAEIMHLPCGGVTWPAVAASEETETHDASVSPHQIDLCLADHIFKRVIYGGWVMRQTRNLSARGTLVPTVIDLRRLASVRRPWQRPCGPNVWRADNSSRWAPAVCSL